MSVLAGRAGNPPEAKTNYIEDILDEQGRNYAIAAALAGAALRRELRWQDVAHALDALEAFEASRESLVALAARQRFDFYRSVGGSALTLEDFKTKCRIALRTGEWV